MVPYGGFWWRVLAYLIDAFVINITVSTFNGVASFGFVPLRSFDDDGLAVWSLMSASVGFTFLLNWLYFALMESSKLQATLGKLAVGVIVADRYGERISFLRASGRYFAKMLSGLIMGIGFLMVAFTERKQGLHDLLANTLVYKTRDPREVQNPESVFA